ncbi:MAG: signal recognition particle-docking protein FtsY [Clostridiales bacterium]|nr:signal recognition particle-docking protein FtsY [Clostridiales bacterium]
MALFKFFKNKKDKNEEEPSLNNLTVQTSDKNNTFENLNPENQISQTEELSEKISDLSKNNLPQSIETIQKNTAAEESKKETSKEIIQSLAAEKEKKKGFFAKIKAGLNKTRQNIMSGVEQVLKSFTKIDEELFEELEEALIMSDIGVETSVYIIEQVRNIVKTEKISDVTEIKNVIIKVITEMLEKDDTELDLKSPSVILVIGVNGVGKTTTIGKLTHNFKEQNKKVILAAADTFRAAAIDQLQIWGERSKVDVIKHQENSDPGAVVFDAVQAAKARNADILICDTAGRLHNKKNLMEELRKISKIINREYSEANVEVFLVLDATTGQNALQQAKLFKEVADITGIVLTKLDGTAKGGIIIAIKNELKIPVRYIGVGEGIDDLQKFNASEFSKALFDSE